VLKAKRQVDMLEPLVADCEQYKEQEQSASQLRACREALHPWFASLKLSLLAKRLATLEEEKARHNTAIARLEEQKQDQLARERELRRTIAQNGGDRLDTLEAEIQKAQTERDRRRKKAERYAELLQTLDVHPAQSEDAFASQMLEMASWQQAAQEDEVRIQNDFNEAHFAWTQEKQAYDELKAEITSLKSRRSNIDDKQVALRRQLCQALSLPEDEMPFAGELIRVRDEERDWEGAIERQLRNFGLSLLVPDPYYAKVSEWVDRTHLQGRLVYFRVRETVRSEGVSLHPDSLVKKLQIKTDSPFYDWIEREIAHRFDLACCLTPEQFRREAKAITRAGQTKAPGERHEKDDRHRIDDRSRYVLGWSNTEKIAASGKTGPNDGKAIGRAFKPQIEPGKRTGRCPKTVVPACRTR